MFQQKKAQICSGKVNVSQEIQCFCLEEKNVI